MTLPNVRNIQTISGRLALDPQSLTSPYPGGGIALGIVQDIVVTIEQPYKFVEAEEYGGQRVEAVITREGCAIGAILRDWDRDAIQQLFPNTSMGGKSGKRMVTAPGSIRPGANLSDRALTLVFWPDDTDRHPMLVLWKAIPAVEAASKIQLHLDKELGIPVLFFGIQDQSGRLYSWGLANDIPFSQDFGYGYNYGLNYGA